MISINSVSIQRSRYPAFAFPAFLNAVSLCKKGFFDEVGHSLSFAAIILKNNKRTVLFGNKSDIDVIVNLFLKRIINDKLFIVRKYIQFNKGKNDLLSFTRKSLNPHKISISSNRELYRLLTDYYQKYEQFCSAITPFIFFVADPLKEEIKKRIKPHHEFLLDSPYLSYITSCEMDYFKHAKTLSNFMSKKWGWIPFDYVGPEEWNADHFLKKMNADYEKTKKIMLDNLNLRKKQHLALKLYPPLIKRLVKSFHIISKMQDDRKGITTLTHVYFQKYLVREISVRTGIKPEHIRIMLPHEIKGALIGGNKPSRKGLDKRLSNSLILFHNGKFSIHQDNKVYEKIISMLPVKKDITGIVACKGKVTGRVKVCLTSDDIPKVKEGDILVAPMTTPNYAVAMGKASGFITDEGGLTSHAAVIAREMNKPCIIGTQSATDILKDNDLVELDANKGIVRKL